MEKWKVALITISAIVLFIFLLVKFLLIPLWDKFIVGDHNNKKKDALHEEIRDFFKLAFGSDLNLYVEYNFFFPRFSKVSIKIPDNFSETRITERLKDIMYDKEKATRLSREFYNLFSRGYEDVGLRVWQIYSIKRMVYKPKFSLLGMHSTQEMPYFSSYK